MPITSLYDYNKACELTDKDTPFYALLMAAMCRADTGNADVLRSAFPLVWKELSERYNSPGGVIAGDAD